MSDSILKKEILLEENKKLKKKIEELETRLEMISSTQSEDILFPLQRIADIMPAFIAYVDIDTLEYRFVNKQFEDSFCLSKNEIIGKHIVELIGKDRYEFARKHIEEVKKGNSSSYINTFDLKEGKRWAKVNYMPDFDDKGKARGIIVLTYDITEIKQVENQLLTNENELKESQKIAQLGSYIFDATTGKWTSSEILDGIMGLEPDCKKDVNTWTQLLHPDDRKLMSLYFTKNILTEHEEFNKEYRIIRKSDGEARWVHGRGKLEIDKDGNVLTMIGTIQDITERVMSNLALHESERRMRLIVEGTPNLFFYTQNIEGKITYISPSVKKITGHSIKDWLNQSHWFLTDNKLNKEAIEKTKTHLRGEFTSTSTMVEIQHAEGYPILLEFYENPMIIDGQVAGIQGVAHDITNRKQAEEALEESTEKYRALSEASFEANFISEKGICIEQNNTAKEIFGYSDEEAIGKMGSDWIAPEDRDTVMKNMLSGFEKAYEVTALRKDGSTFPAMIHAKMMKYKGKSVRFTSLYDITQEKLAREKLHENEMYLKKAERVAKFGNWVLDLKNKTLQASEGAQSIYGATSDEFNYDQIKQFSLPEYREYLDIALVKLIKKEEPYKVEFKIRRGNDGEVIDIQSIAEYDPTTKIVFGVIKDVTEQKKAEEKLNMLAKALTTVNECVSMTNPNEELIFVNESFMQTYGYSESELLGNNTKMIRSDNNPPEIIKQIKPETLRGGWNGVLWNKHKDGSEFPIQLSTAVIKDGKGNPVAFVGVGQDITEQIQKEKELIEAKEVAERSNRIKSEFLAQMSHEIRTPINTMLNFTNLIKYQVGDIVNEELQEGFSIIDAASQRVIRTIDMILNMSEIQTGTYEFKAIDLDLDADVLQNILKEFSAIAKGRGLKLIFKKKAESSKIFADEYSVIQIFANLVDNALKYTKEGKVEVIISELKKSISVKVKDTGVGISEEYLPSLFEPFSQEEQGYTRRFEGNGLGLALVKEYCEMNNATISVKSTKGTGTTFTVLFNKLTQ